MGFCHPDDTTWFDGACDAKFPFVCGMENAPSAGTNTTFPVNMTWAVNGMYTTCLPPHPRFMDESMRQHSLVANRIWFESHAYPC